MLKSLKDILFNLEECLGDLRSYDFQKAKIGLIEVVDRVENNIEQLENQLSLEIKIIADRCFSMDGFILESIERYHELETMDNKYQIQIKDIRCLIPKVYNLSGTRDEIFEELEKLEQKI